MDLNSTYDVLETWISGPRKLFYDNMVQKSVYLREQNRALLQRYIFINHYVSGTVCYLRISIIWALFCCKVLATKKHVVCAFFRDCLNGAKTYWTKWKSHLNPKKRVCTHRKSKTLVWILVQNIIVDLTFSFFYTIVDIQHFRHQTSNI